MDRTDGQKRALAELRAIERAGPYSFEVLGDRDNDPNLLVDVTVSCAALEREPTGLPLRQRERLCILVTPDFPFRPPSLWTLHKRFAGHPHVQWARHLCLYRASAVEWNPGDGMFGFVDRIATFLERGARGELDALGAPLHPPVAYAVTDELVIPRVNTPAVGYLAWTGLAQLQNPTAKRIDIVGWTTGLETKAAAPVAAAILLADPMPFEFPKTVAELLEALAERGIDRRYLVLTLMMAALQNLPGTPLFVVIGTPMRGIAGETALQQHLAVFRIDADAAKALELAACQYSRDELLKGIGATAEALFWTWAASAKASWCEVREDRPEVTVRRDSKTAMSWFAGKTVTLWGCGGLGSYIAEYLTRADVRAIGLHDSGKVAPGLLVRQLFSDADIGYPKVEALEKRLKAIRPDLQVTVDQSDLLSTTLSGSRWPEGADVVIDTTGSNAIATALEHARRGRSSAPTFASLTLDARAERGLVAIAPSEHSGSILDVVRRAKLEVCRRGHLTVYADAFWPAEALNGLVEPEPGCSSPTFAASAADVAQLSGALLNRLAIALAEGSERASAHFVSRGDVPRLATASFALEADLSLQVGSSYELRLSSSAWKEMRAWIRKARRENGGRVETGGLLFGERDGAANVLWVSEVSGPPGDSSAAETHFVCGTRGMSELNEEKRRRSRGAVSFIGMWHTHPGGAPIPSVTDREGMRQIILAGLPSTPESLLLIVGGDLERDPILGASVFSRSDLTHP